jgi:hypothetical protein
LGLLVLGNLTAARAFIPPPVSPVEAKNIKKAALGYFFTWCRHPDELHLRHEHPDIAIGDGPIVIDPANPGMNAAASFGWAALSRKSAIIAANLSTFLEELCE